MNNRLSPDPGFGLFLATTATLFLRPAELFEALDGLPIYEACIGGSILFAARDLQRKLSWRTIRFQPVVVCALGMMVAIVISLLTHMYFGGMIDAATNFGKTLIYFFLVICYVDNIARLRWYLLTLAVCSVTSVALSVIDFHGIVDFPFIQPLLDNDGEDEEGEILQILRMRGIGIFQDPNDFAMLIVATGILCTYFLTDKKQSWFRFAWLAPIALLGVGLLDTRSRGGLLASGVAVMTLLSFWGGVRAGIFFALMGVLGLGVMGGRQANMDLGDSTGGERVELWREGFDALKSPDILFGTGYGSYPDIAGLVAHNSYIHAYTELGLFGGTLFFGAFFCAFQQLLVMGSREYSERDAEMLRFRPFLGAMLAGWCASMFSLSRCYVVPTYLVLGLAAAYLHIAGRRSLPPEPLSKWTPRQFRQLVTASAMTFVGLYLFVKVLR